MGTSSAGTLRQEQSTVQSQDEEHLVWEQLLGRTGKEKAGGMQPLRTARCLSERENLFSRLMAGTWKGWD